MFDALNVFEPITREHYTLSRSERKKSQWILRFKANSLRQAHSANALSFMPLRLYVRFVRFRSFHLLRFLSRLPHCVYFLHRSEPNAKLETCCLADNGIYVLQQARTATSVEEVRTAVWNAAHLQELNQTTGQWATTARVFDFSGTPAASDSAFRRSFGCGEMTTQVVHSGCSHLLRCVG